MKEGIRKIAFPDCTADDLCQAFFDRFSKTQDLIINEINELTDNVESEFSRIVRVFMRLAIQQMFRDVPDYFSQEQLEDNAILLIQ